MLDGIASNEEIQQAEACGRAVGLQRLRQARECPHSFRHADLRRAWLSRFGIGRSQCGGPEDGAQPVENAPRRITYSLPLRCPRCGRAGTALASEIDELDQDNIVFRVEALSPGFRETRQGRSLGDTSIVCIDCNIAAR
ncbi:hypothetical protein P7D22_17105 [Lichenihabitans sp. Uapishka_5]|uniref:hypothetical protein n=1 Tax=Lichenihabitans sp. Uapishka_5 TaxID=3037302 RepID=UPI0029E7D062|nr:hypothetical protein [Lichenihabitans sp. Uapishka_5]MDX7952886.1 hypothetical protein [Lichenihabitans sp. Uapishka_5]